MSFEFEIFVDPVRSIVRMRLGGFLLPQDVVACRAKRNEAYKRLRCGPNNQLVIIDMREMAIQPKETVHEFETTLRNPATRSKRLAIVVGRTLWRSQIRRAANGRDIGFFEDLDEAERWLTFSDATAHRVPYQTEIPCGAGSSF